jgi:DNA-directed RNA polymerase subunit RPC12/RpoP
MAPTGESLAALGRTVRVPAQRVPRHTGAICPRCLSRALVQSRHSLGIYRLARWIGMTVYRCGQCGKRSLWWYRVMRVSPR